MTDDPKPRPWGPFGMGEWKGHPDVFCRVCGWPVYSMWIDKTPPPGDCPNGKTSARSCDDVLDRLMQSAWVRAGTGNADGDKPPHPATEMMRATTGLTWPEIEAMCDKKKRASHTIQQLRDMRKAETAGKS